MSITQLIGPSEKSGSQMLIQELLSKGLIKPVGSDQEILL